jgi:hypothetical protein
MELNDMVPDAGIMLQNAYSAQEDIGWNEWFRGRISKKWKDLYEYDLQHTNHNMQHQTPEKWAVQIILLTWKFVLESWSIRNSIEHGLDSDPLLVRKQKLI